MKDEYSISIERVGMADLPELCRTDSPESAAEVIRALLAVHDPLIMGVHISIVRMKPL